MQRFHNIHAGETALLVGNGNNLHLTPPAWFDYPAFGMNTIHNYEGWTPTYYTAVDNRVMREFGKEIEKKYRDIPKFIPHPNLDDWKGENFYRFYHRAGAVKANRKIDTPTDGIAFSNIMSVAMQLAFYMGFTTLLIVGMEHKPGAGQAHFWGQDAGMPNTPPVADWYNAYKTLVTEFAGAGVKVLNISQDTYCPEEIIPRGDWREWRTHESIPN